MNRIPMMLAAALAVMPATRALAAGVAVFSTNAVNLTQGEAEAAATVVAEAYGRLANVYVVGPRKAAVALEKDHDLAAAARSLDVDEYLEVSTIGLFSNDLELQRSGAGTRLSTDSRVIVQAARYTADGKLVFRAEMTGASMADLEIVAQRLARALWEKRAPEDTRSIHTVTRREAIAENRVWTEKVMGIKTQAAFAVASGQQYDPLISIGFDGRLEGPRYFLEVGAGATLPASSDNADSRGYGGVYAELGGSYYLTDASTSTYIGGGVIPRLMGGSGDDSPVKMAAYGQVGLMFARESSTRLYVDLRVTQNLMAYHTGSSVYVYNQYGYVQVSEKKSYYPTEIGIELGIGW